MLPVIHIFGVPVELYGVCLALGVSLVYFWLRYRAPDPATRQHLTWMSFWGIWGALLGSKLLKSLMYPDTLWFPTVGNNWYGGLLGITAALVAYCRIRKLPLGYYADLIAPPVAMGFAVIKLGCFFKGCCYGAVTTLPWGIHYPAFHPTAGHTVHPSPLYESSLMILVSLLLLQLDRIKPFEGYLFAFFLTTLGGARLFLDTLRAQRNIVFPPLDLSTIQLMSLVFFMTGLVLIFYCSAREKRAAS